MYTSKLTDLHQFQAVFGVHFATVHLLLPIGRTTGAVSWRVDANYGGKVGVKGTQYTLRIIFFVTACQSEEGGGEFKI